MQKRNIIRLQEMLRGTNGARIDCAARPNDRILWWRTCLDGKPDYDDMDRRGQSLHETHSASILRGHFLKRDELGNRSEPTTLVTVD
jgi:hypothetical protein